MAIHDHPSSRRTALSAKRRADIEAEIELHLQRVTLLVARLDRDDAPFEDLEDDDPCGGFDDREVEPWRDERFTMPLPAYGLDQAAGPTNYRTAEHAHDRYLRSSLALLANDLPRLVRARRGFQLSAPWAGAPRGSWLLSAP